jgi:hypothetical protein
LLKNNKTGIVGEEKEAFTFGRKAASASGENSVHLPRNTHLSALLIGVVCSVSFSL